MDQLVVHIKMKVLSSLISKCDFNAEKVGTQKNMHLKKEMR